MSETRHHGGAGASFTLLLVLGFIVMFWRIFAIIAGVAVLGVAAWYVTRRIDARTAARAAIVARADEQHKQIMAGDDRGLYGEYPPAAV
jgi:hypothetical protein